MWRWGRSLCSAIVVATVAMAPETAWAACEPVVSEKPAGEVDVHWCGATGVANLRLVRRVDERMTVAITSHHFNFLQYGIDYKVEDKVVDAYVTMDKLWSQIFRVVGLLEGVPSFQMEPRRAAALCGSFQTCLVEWMWSIQLANMSVDETIGAYAQTGPGLTDAQVKAIADYAEMGAPKHRDAVVKARQKLVGEFKPDTLAEIDIFIRSDTEHGKIIDKLTAFQVAASLVENGQRKVIDKKKAGTLVTVTVTPKSRFEGADGGRPLSVEYFVHSRFPLTYHMGYAYSRLQDVEFETVRALSGQDLFSRVKNQKDVTAFTAFLSYPLKTWPSAETKYGVYATLGTDFEKPGDRLYGALSARFAGRILLDVGIASATVKEGGNEVLEQVGDGLGTRQLFDAVTTRRDWKPFVGISVAVF